ncbi:PEX10 family protein [Megaselia abdita]
MDCGICLEIISSNASCTKCGHIFHTKCIKPWLRSRNICPICKRGYRDSELIKIFGGNDIIDSEINETRGRTKTRSPPKAGKSILDFIWIFILNIYLFCSKLVSKIFKTGRTSQDNSDETEDEMFSEISFGDFISSNYVFQTKYTSIENFSSYMKIK